MRVEEPCLLQACLDYAKMKKDGEGESIRKRFLLLQERNPQCQPMAIYCRYGLQYQQKVQMLGSKRGRSIFENINGGVSYALTRQLAKIGTVL